MCTDWDVLNNKYVHMDIPDISDIQMMSQLY